MDVEKLSFEELATKFEPLIKKQLRTFHAANHYEELYQIGLIALWEAKRKFNKDKGSFPPYAKKYIRGRMLHFLAREKKHKDTFTPMSDSFVFEQITAPKTIFYTTIQLQPLLPFLTERERLWLTEFLVHENKLTKIAAKHNVSINTVKSWRKSAIKKLKKLTEFQID